ncbi:glycoside hydrolase family 65 protein [Fusibacter tunisiensis]|uniref:Alpha,alpha-trehalose phosphorylase n=1 Tax=Fusibacter tunisiensis TaxID=1008308 RepID=A0ABS2MQL4_9FIRM|nr:glycosyl hydrolase family 65 protein [Fusibacter tunisiensis]MBM7561680.1 alpha,alpha-trehalose phosphorylase [Fusibacter tunisiensis]
MWRLTQNYYTPSRQVIEESLFMVGNGYVGVRGCFEEGYPSGDTIRGTYINGLFDRVPMQHAEMAYGLPIVQDKQPRIADTQTCKIWLDDEPVQLIEGKFETYYRHLDYHKGTSERSYVFMTSSGYKGHLKFTRMASLVNPHLFLYRIEVIYDGAIRLESVLEGGVENYSNPADPRTGAGHTKLMTILKLGHTDAESFVTLETSNTNLQQATVVKHMVYSDAPVDISYASETSAIHTTVEGKQHLVLEKLCAFTDSLRFENPTEAAFEMLAHEDVSNLEKRQVNYLDEYWRLADIEIEGNMRDQRAVRFMMYQLLQSVGTDAFSNISAKGLSGEGYEGHYFWDTEIYVIPILLINQPERVKHLLEYRARILDAARQRALELGHEKGAAYAWRTISGIECSGYFPAGTAQYHINADIAHAFIQYYLYTEDINFLVGTGVEVILETARIWMEIGNFKDGLFHIHSVTGPDEYTAIVNDNYYTNAMAKYHLKWAHDLYQMLGASLDPTIKTQFEALRVKLNMNAEEVEHMLAASNQMYLPYDDQLGIYAQDANFLKKPVWPFENENFQKRPLLLHYHPLTIYRHQVLKQADTILAHFMLEEYADEASIFRGFDYYEQITTHDSSLSSCIYGIMAARRGNRDKAYAYFEDSVMLDLEDRHGNTKDGLHMANISGTVLTLLAGFAGFRHKDDGLHLRPILPKDWTGYSFNIRYRNRLISVRVTERIHLALKVGAPMEIKVYGQSVQLTKACDVDMKRE